MSDIDIDLVTGHRSLKLGVVLDLEQYPVERVVREPVGQAGDELLGLLGGLQRQIRL